MRVAFYECDITPPLGGNMPGGFRENRAMDVFEQLYAKAVVIEDEGKYAAIVSMDICGVGAEFHDVITKRVQEYTGIEPASVCIHAVHTHKGAPIGNSPEVGQEYDEAYTDVCMRRAADAIILAYKRLRDGVEIKFGCGKVEGISYNRNYVVEGGEIRSFGPGNKKFIRTLAGIDPDLPVVTFHRDGEPIGAIISFACHQDCTDRAINGYSADYSGILARELKKKYGPDFVSVFLIGAAGDINHFPNDPSVKLPPLWYREMGKIIAKEAIRVIDTDSKPIGEGIDVIKEEIELPIRYMDMHTACQQIKKWTDQDSMMRILNLAHYFTLDYYAKTRKEFDYLWLQAIRVGNLCIYLSCGEIFVNLGLKIKANSPFEYTMVVEHCNSPGGYLPTVEAFAEGSDLYETSLCKTSHHFPEAGEQIVERLLEMGGKLNAVYTAENK